MTNDLTLAQYFTAHAPEAPAWFNPEMREKPKVRMRYNVRFSSEAEKVLLRFFNDEMGEWYDPDGKVPDSFKEAANTWITERVKEIKDEDNWHRERQQAVFWQWPVYYGEMMAEKFTRRLDSKPTSATHYLLKTERQDGSIEYELVVWHKPNNHYHIPISANAFDNMKAAYKEGIRSEVYGDVLYRYNFQ